MSPSKKTSRELAGTLRNLKKVEQALQTLMASTEDDEEDSAESPNGQNEIWQTTAQVLFELSASANWTSNRTIDHGGDMLQSHATITYSK